MMFISVVAASKATVNVGVILAGVAVTGSLLYLIGKELFGSDSTTAIFSDAVDRINAHQEVQVNHGMCCEPIIHSSWIRSLNFWESLSKHMVNQVESVIDVFSTKLLRMVKATHICLCDSTLKDKTTEALLYWKWSRYCNVIKNQRKYRDLKTCYIGWKWLLAVQTFACWYSRTRISLPSLFHRRTTTMNILKRRLSPTTVICESMSIHSNGI